MNAFNGIYDVPCGPGGIRETGTIKLFSAGASVSLGGQIRIPLNQYKTGAPYEFTFNENGIDFKWIEQRAAFIEGNPNGCAVFVLNGLD